MSGARMRLAAGLVLAMTLAGCNGADDSQVQEPGQASIPEPTGEDRATPSSPNPPGEQARAAVEALLAGFRTAQADPRAGVGTSWAAVVADPLESELASALAEQASAGFSITSPSDLALEVEGPDPGGVVMVSSCLTFPEGVALRDLGSGEVVREVFPPGTQSEMVFAVRLNGVDGPEVFEQVSETLPTSC